MIVYKVIQVQGLFVVFIHKFQAIALNILNNKLERYIKIPWILDSIVIPVSATIFCFPVIILLSNQFSLATIPANILVAPVIAPITVLGFIAAILAPIAGS
ncbi:MAG: hypothetical protein EBR91_10245, partial [Flavobacteriia bacterium]|nr:hypothetical protein [Flavobacteriia bacterium]